MKKERIKSYIIIFFVLLVLLFGIIQIINLSQSAKAETLFKQIIELQINVSEYLGKMEEKTYGAYTKEQIIIGSTDFKKLGETKIKDYKNNELMSLVNYNEQITKDDVNFYKINNSNLKKVLNIELDEELNIDFYMSSKRKSCC